MSYGMKKFKFFGIYNKYTFSPIEYKGEKYLVEIEQENFLFVQECYFRVYEYRSTKRLSKGKLLYVAKYMYMTVYKGNHIDLGYKGHSNSCVSPYDLPENEISLYDLPEKELLMYLPELMKSLFKGWDKKKDMDYKHEKETKKREENLQWDGVVK